MSREWKTLACPHDCPDGCIMLGREEQPGGEIALRSRDDLPWNASFCPRGRRWFARRSHPRRIRTPLLREGSSFRPVSWDTAWDVWAGALERTLESSGPLGNALYQSAGSLFFSKNLLSVVHSALGGYTRPGGNLCSSAGNQGLKNSFGFVPVQRRETLEKHGKSILFWGRNVVENHVHLLGTAQKLRARGGSMGVVEIRSTATTAWGDRFWNIAPGGDCFLAAWLCKKLLEESREESAPRMLSMKNALAFQEYLKNQNGTFLLERAEIALEEAESLYAWLLASAPVTHYMGYGIQRYLHGEMQFWWIAALAVLLGARDIPGAGVVYGKDEMASFPDELIPASREERLFPVGIFWESLLQAVPKVETITILCADPVKQSPNSSRTAEILRRIPFSVCVDCTLTETAKCCSLVLPSALFFEDGPDWRGSYWHSLVCRTEQLLPPPGECLGDTAILDGLGKRLGVPETLLPGELRRRMDVLLLNSSRLCPLGPSVFSLEEPELWNTEDVQGVFPLKLPENPGAEESLFPKLRLITYHGKEYINGQNWDLSAPPEATLFLAPRDAERRNVSPGDRVFLRGERDVRSEALRIALDPSMASGCCACPQGLPLSNRCTRSGLVSPGYGVPFHESFVTLQKE